MTDSQSSTDSLPDWLVPAIARLLEACGKESDFHLQPLAGGANNRVFRIRRSDGDVLVKWYFADPDDPRDRLRAEWDFSDFAWRHGLRQLPQPLACDPAQRLGMYEFVEGRQLAPHEVTLARVREAAQFGRALNRFRHTEDARLLGPVSEACFSIDQHLACGRARVVRLMAAVDAAGTPPAARQLVRDRLLPRWRQVEQLVRSDAAARDKRLDTELPQTARILSPSDFGFHNALVDKTDMLRFFDFEYAGWDDPAKTICDFFCQVAVPVPGSFFDDFVDVLLEPMPERPELRRRAELLLPVYRLKWCSIVLNPLLGVGQRRRAFSRQEEGVTGPGGDEPAWLDAARRILNRLE